MSLLGKLFRRSGEDELPLAPIVVPMFPDFGQKRPALDSSIPLSERIDTVLLEVRPYLHGDGGDVEVVNIREDGVVEMHFVGACQGCPASRETLKLGIESALRERIPEIKEVVAV